MLHKTLITLCSLALCATLAACGTADLGVGCKADNECQLGFVCQDGACKCRTDDACGNGQYCNPYGTCQVRPACLGNQDCDKDSICNSADSSGGVCIPALANGKRGCGSSAHCNFGEYCGPQSHACEPGCRGTGDCKLGDVCVAGGCQSGGIADDCTICPASPDPDSTYCDYGEVCTLAGACMPHSEKTNICASCGQTSPCQGDTICLIDNEQAGANYCSPGCSIDSDCPSGYSGCGKLQLVDPAMECTNTGTCSNGAPCLGGGEANQAFCGCVSDAECGTGAICDTFFSQSCLNTGWSCSSDTDCAVSCVQIQFGSSTAGICLTNKGACGKDAGATCTELKTGTATCREL